MLEANLEKKPPSSVDHICCCRCAEWIRRCLVVRIPKTFELEEVRDNKNIAEVGENNK